MARSPGVDAFEFDATINVSATGESGAATVGRYTWGPVDQEIQVSSIDDFITVFNTPTNDNFQDWFSATNFLHYSANLYNIRIVDQDTAKNAGIVPVEAPEEGDALFEKGGVLFKNSSDFEMLKSTSTALFAARYAGKLGDSLEISFADASTYATWQYKDEFDTAPNSSPGSETFIADANDELHIVVIDKGGLFTRTPGAILERFAYLSKAADGRDTSGSGSYYKSVISRTSKYVYAVNDVPDSFMLDVTGKSSWGGELLTGNQFAELKTPFTGRLGGGSNGETPSKSDYIAGFERLEAIEDEQLTMIITGACGGDENHAEVSNLVLDMAARTKRFVGFVSPKASDVVNVSSKNDAITNIEATHAALTSLHSYGHMSTSYKMQYDKFNDAYRWIPGNADDAGLYARTHNTVGKYASGAGYNRGKYANVVSLAFNPDRTARDRLYRFGINSVIQERGEGVILMGDRTLQPKKSAFSQMGTRFLFIELRTIIARSAKYSLFENNDQFTRAQFRDSIEPLLRDIRGRRGIVDYLIRCDETNNPTSVVESGEFVGDIYIKPQYSIQYIRLNFIAVGQDVSFDETTNINAVPV